jgi:hypothetical protein
MVSEKLRPFILSVEGRYSGMPIAVAVGVELGLDEDDAFHRAVLRFPPSRFLLLPPLEWEETPVEVRLLAIKMDMMGSPV